MRQDDSGRGNRSATPHSSQLGASLGVSHTTVRSYLDLLTQTFMVRLLEPFSTNSKKRLVKSPKVYLRDSGILHSLLQIDTLDDLLAHPVCGESWEGWVIENVFATLPGPQTERRSRQGVTVTPLRTLLSRLLDRD